ncbi:Gfo/Idh/MocA family protein [Clostridium gasigenes]|uniref:Gfo/Idh/MocA family protein n=1 Tax=Clostridium gasigenes TaxID=94869 RepID=UPI0014383DE4|nr:Gfo/Idh/MocA family oxidoreductase [Clostridium gasigenes]MBU3103359.1 Gfo/Idh/MocA family oxidoreductase [Clostridium gasigenes]MBU3137348.1 Gfo/Idh/MocA family oxidoreductase [Clostridium gasigenes]NKF07633.1 Gfo/Idh/MocA family oxidoreductase [Clostridium gasigenes]QSW18061.1 Gfo/Idh/MocA family oxidoreductase [Clostridium gasigenes]
MINIRVGVVGTNNITDWFLSGAKDVEGFKLAAVYSRSESKAREYANKYGVKDIFTDLEEMAKSDLIDAVYIATPNSLHSEQSILFLENKKHVLCEKAFGSNLKEVEAMIKSAKENKVLLMEAMKTTMLPNFQVVKENLHRIGKVRKCSASFCQYSSRYDKYKNGEVLNAFKPELSNGALMDIGVYCIEPIINLFGKPKSIKANGLMLESGVDGSGSIILDYEDMDGVVMFSKISNSYLPSEIQGEDGSIIIEKINTFSKVKLILKNGEEIDLSKQQVDDDMYYEAKEFISLIQNKELESKVNTFETSINTIAVMDEARRQIGLVYPADKK